MVFRMFVRIMLAILLTSSLACLATRQSITTAPEPEQDQTFTVIMEGDDGQMIGYDKFPGHIAQFATTATLNDGAVLVTDITDRAVRRQIQKTVNTILKGHKLPQMRLESLLENRHITCHVAVEHHPSLDGFAGPALFDCINGLLVGTTALSPDLPIWKQRGLLLPDKAYPDRIHLVPVPPESASMQASQRPASVPMLDSSQLTWEQAAPYLSSVIVLEEVMTDEGPKPSLKICVGENNLTASQREQRRIVEAAVQALVLFTTENEGNPQLIVRHMKDGRFAVEELDESIQQHLLWLMNAELNPVPSSMNISSN